MFVRCETCLSRSTRRSTGSCTCQRMLKRSPGGRERGDGAGWLRFDVRALPVQGDRAGETQAVESAP